MAINTTSPQPDPNAPKIPIPGGGTLASLQNPGPQMIQSSPGEGALPPAPQPQMIQGGGGSPIPPPPPTPAPQMIHSGGGSPIQGLQNAGPQTAPLAPPAPSPYTPPAIPPPSQVAPSPMYAQGGQGGPLPSNTLAPPSPQAGPIQGLRRSVY